MYGQEGQLILLNTFNTVRPRPYLNNNQGGLKKADDGDVNQRQNNPDAQQQNSRQQEGDVVARGRASQQIAQNQMNGRYQNSPQRASYPVGYTPYQRPNYPSNNAPMRQTPPQMQGGRFAPVQNDLNQPSP